MCCNFPKMRNDWVAVKHRRFGKIVDTQGYGPPGPPGEMRRSTRRALIHKDMDRLDRMDLYI